MMTQLMTIGHKDDYWSVLMQIVKAFYRNFAAHGISGQHDPGARCT